MRDQTPRLDLHLAHAKIRDLRGHRRQGSAIDNNTFYRVARPQGWLGSKPAWMPGPLTTSPIGGSTSVNGSCQVRRRWHLLTRSSESDTRRGPLEIVLVGTTQSMASPRSTLAGIAVAVRRCWQRCCLTVR